MSTSPPGSGAPGARKQELFLAALELPEATRREFLDHRCGTDDALRAGVEALLANHIDDSFLEVPVPPATAVKPTLPAEQTGENIGRYKLLQKLGEGGMGAVWMAEQEEPVRRKVALKVIKAGMDTREVIARFEAERQALAMMDHPNIAKFFDAGVTGSPHTRPLSQPMGEGGQRPDEGAFQPSALNYQPPPGRPYFVMELVPGIRLTDYCDQNHLPLRERLDLFTKVCHAVQHAHQKGIIHRDLKPSNILVTLHDGVPVPKVIDFGIAKATQQRLTDKTLFTQLGHFIGTPAYMSPEQAELSGLDIDTRSDIYSLGVLLYQLLTGTTPFDAKELLAAGFDEMRRIIRETEPPTPSARLTTLAAADVRRLHSESETRIPKSEIDPDLDWIVMKCLEKNRQRRYETASSLATDIQRHLHSEPVTARPPTAAYRFQRLVRRNRLAFAAAAAVAFTLLVGTVVSTWQAVRATRAEGVQQKLRHAAIMAREKAQASEALAQSHAARAEASAAASLRTLATADFAQAVRLSAEGCRSDALAYLLRSLSAQPTNAAALTRLATLLASHGWHVPVSVFPHGHPVPSAEFSSDGRLVATASMDRTARIWDARTSLPLTAPLAHEHPVFAVRFSADGQALVTASGTGMWWSDSLASGDVTVPGAGAAQVWDVRTGQPRTNPLRHSNDVNAAEFSPDGTLVVTASSDLTARIWDSRSGEPVTPPLPHLHWVRTAKFSSDGRRVVTATGDRWSPRSGTARVWDARTGKALTELMMHGGAVAAVEFGPDGERVLTASHDGMARVWSVRTGQPVTAGMSHQGAIYSAHFSPDGTRVVTASIDGTARVWDAQNGQPLAGPLRHEGVVRAARFSADGGRVVTASMDRTARVWDVRTGQPVTEPLKHARWVWTAQFSPDGLNILTASGDGTARVWEAFSAPALSEPLRHGGALISAEFSNDGRRIATAATNGTARIWDVPTGQDLTQPLRHGAKIESVRFSADGRWLATASADTTARVWHAHTGAMLSEFSHPGGVVHSVEFSPDGRRVVTASADTTARVWNAQTGQPLTAPLQHANWVRYAEFDPAGNKVVTASGDGTARIWDARTGQSLAEPLRHERWLRFAHFSRDGRRLITASADGTARIWDAPTGRPLTEPLRHDGIVRMAQFSPEGDWAVTASSDGAARLWNARTGRSVAEPLHHEGAVLSARFSPDSCFVVTASADGTARLWETLTGRPVMEPMRHQADVVSAIFSPDGRRIVTASADGTARVWDVVTAGPKCPEWLALLAEAVGGQVLNKEGVLEETKLNRAEVLRQIRDQLRREPDDDRVVWGRWFLAHPATRTVSPFSKLTVPEYIENRIKDNTPESLAEAERLAAGHRTLSERIANRRAAPRP